ncbi:hypothetical protein AVE30378_01393 [Achromobacter veterisilvae]|uniref:Protein kinase domain-containing protein n=1 Tax=Achromobacter veterisilvae TaxID=2069367 RepID=A0A446CBK1_9BURK|nr:phosphotransferase family protein [Achromobacter veterisilvae]SSW65233.1 hypothetical protein AVE30378_01393 [Achromobacter veterisilvae]
MTEFVEIQPRLAEIPPPASDLHLPRLRRFLDTRLPGGVGATLAARLIAGGRSNPTYEIDDGRNTWILRRPPFGLVLPTAHDMKREYRVLSALAAQGYPVPTPLAYCEDLSIAGCAFYVMEKVDGITLRTQQQAAALTPAQRTGLSGALIRTLAELHQIDAAAAQLDDFGRPRGYLNRQLERWKKQWDASCTRPRDSISKVLEKLGAAVPPLRYPGIVHGDYKVDNLMLDRQDPTRILGVLDWEMSTHGDTLADLGILLSFWDEPDRPFNPITAGTTALAGFLSTADLLERYAACRRIDPPEIDWYIAFADFKIAVILEGIHARHLKGHTRGADFDNVGEMVDPLLARALRRLSP